MLNDSRFLTSGFAERRGQKDKNCPSTKHSLSLSFLWCCWGSVRLRGHSKSSPGVWAQSHLYSRLLLHNYWGPASPVPRAGPRYPLERRCHGELSPMHSNGTIDLSRAPWRSQDGFCLQVPEWESAGRYFNSWAYSQPSCRVSGLQEKSFQNQ